MLYLIKTPAFTCNFRLRKDKITRGSKAPLRMQISVDRKLGSPFTITHVPVALWDQKKQQLKGRSEEAFDINAKLAAIKVKVRSIYDRQSEKGIRVTSATVRWEFLNKMNWEDHPDHGIKPAEFTLINALSEYAIYYKGLKGEMALSEKTIYNKDLMNDYVLKYLDTQPIPLALHIDSDWIARFHLWACQNVEITIKTASRTCKQIEIALEYCKQKKLIAYNPIAGIKLPAGQTKPVYTLSRAQVETFFAMPTDEMTASLHKWYALFLLTGLDYPDLRRYMRDRSRYEQETPKGRIIAINRAKTGQLSVIPLDRHPMADRFFNLLESPPVEEVKHRALHGYASKDVAQLSGRSFQ